MSGGAASEGSSSPAMGHATDHSSSGNSSSSGTAVDGDTQTSSGKGKKCKLVKREATNELLEKMVDLQAE